MPKKKRIPFIPKEPAKRGDAQRDAALARAKAAKSRKIAHGFDKPRDWKDYV